MPRVDGVLRLLATAMADLQRNRLFRAGYFLSSRNTANGLSVRPSSALSSAGGLVTSSGNTLSGLIGTSGSANNSSSSMTSASTSLPSSPTSSGSQSGDSPDSSRSDRISPSRLCTETGSTNDSSER